MSKHLSHALTYDASPAEVAAMLADPEFRAEVCRAQRVHRQEIRIDALEGGHLEIVIDQWQETAGMPSFAKKFVGDETHIIQAESWADPTMADLVVTFPGKPGDMRGTLRITEYDGVTTETVDLTIKIGIPLLGGKIEALISDLLLKALLIENQVGRDYLSR